MFCLGNGYGLGGWLTRAIAENRRADVRHYPEPTPSDGDRYWMHQALLAAMENVGLASPNPTVGAVFVKDGQLLTKGATLKFGDLHGERDAIQKLTDRSLLKGSTAYVLLEPCSHVGQQPPCVEALIEVGIQRCVIASRDPNPKVAGEGIAKLQKHGVDVVLGPLAGEAIGWNYPFFGEQILGRPMVMAKWAQTLDGHLADDVGGSQWISGAASRSYGHWLRQKYDAILIGAGTALADKPRLNVRDAAKPHHRQPLKIIFDPSGRLLKLKDAAFQELQKSTLTGDQAIYIGLRRQAWEEAQKRTRHPFHKMIHLSPILLDDAGGNEIQEFLMKLAAVQLPHGRRIQSILVEGGPTLLTLMQQRDLIDGFHCFVNPSILGGRENRIGTLKRRNKKTEPVASRLFGQMDRYRLLGLQQLDNDALMEFLPHDRYDRIIAPYLGRL